MWEMVFCFSSYPSTHLLFSHLLLRILICSPKLTLNSCQGTPLMRPALEQPVQKVVAGCTSPHTQGTSSWMLRCVENYENTRNQLWNTNCRDIVHFHLEFHMSSWCKILTSYSWTKGKILLDVASQLWLCLRCQWLDCCPSAKQKSVRYRKLLTERCIHGEVSSTARVNHRSLLIYCISYELHVALVKFENWVSFFFFFFFFFFATIYPTKTSNIISLFEFRVSGRISPWQCWRSQV